MRNSLSSTDQPGDGLAGFVDLVVGDVTSGAYGVLDAGTEVVVEEREGERLERFGDRGDLGEDVDAVLVVCDHLLQAADLALDAAQPVEVRGLGLVSARRGDFSHVTTIPVPGMSLQGGVGIVAEGLSTVMEGLSGPLDCALTRTATSFTGGAAKCGQMMV